MFVHGVNSLVKSTLSKSFFCGRKRKNSTNRLDSEASLFLQAHPFLFAFNNNHYPPTPPSVCFKRWFPRYT